MVESDVASFLAQSPGIFRHHCGETPAPTPGLGLNAGKLIDFRVGRIADGRAQYLRATEGANEPGLTSTGLRAMAYHAREEIPEWTPAAVQALTDAIVALPEQSLSNAPSESLLRIGADTGGAARVAASVLRADVGRARSR